MTNVGGPRILRSALDLLKAVDTGATTYMQLSVTVRRFGTSADPHFIITSRGGGFGVRGSSGAGTVVSYTTAQAVLNGMLDGGKAYITRINLSRPTGRGIIQNVILFGSNTQDKNAERKRAAATAIQAAVRGQRGQRAANFKRLERSLRPNALGYHQARDHFYTLAVETQRPASKRKRAPPRRAPVS